MPTVVGSCRQVWYFPPFSGPGRQFPGFVLVASSEIPFLQIPHGLPASLSFIMSHYAFPFLPKESIFLSGTTTATKDSLSGTFDEVNRQ